MSSRGLFVQFRDSYRGKNSAVDISLVGRTDIRIALEESKAYTVRDLIAMVCKKRNMAPKSVDLFGLALDENGVNWLSASRKVDRQVLKRKLYFLLRFKVFQCDELQQFDENAFMYYLSQCRKDLRRGKYAKILDSSVKEMLRMVILEAVLVAKDKNLSLKDVLPKAANDKKGKQRLEQFLSREVSLEDILLKNVKEKADIQQSKKIVEKSLERFTQVKRPEIDFLKELDYIKRFSEEHFTIKKESLGKQSWNEVFELRIHPDEGVHRYTSVENKIMTLIKTLEFKDILSLELESSPMGETQIRLVPEKGIPEVFLCDTEAVAESICSLIDGYYRLLVNHNESLFKDVLPRVPEFVHGPIDRVVAEAILNNTAESGVYLVRESGQTFGHYVVSCRAPQAGICHYKVNFDETEGKCWIEGGHRFTELRDLLRYYHNATESPSICLRRNLRPSVTGAVPLIAKGITTPPELPRASRGHREPGIISLNKLQIIKTFQQERYSETSIAKIVGSETIQPFLLKKLNKEEVSQEVFREVFMCYRSFEHRNVLELLHVSWPTEDEAFFCLGFEYSELGPLDEYVTQACETISYGRLLKFFYDTAHGMNYITKDMHQVHGNLRARNLIVCKGVPEPVVKVSDAYTDVAMLNAGLLENKHFADRCNWYAPEILEGQPFSSKSDAWSFGMAMWEVLAQQIPYGRIDVLTLRESMKNDILPSLEILPYCSESLQALFWDLWKKDAGERHDFQGICNTLERIKRGEESRVKSQPYFRREDFLRKREELNRSLETKSKPDEDALGPYHKIEESGSVKEYAFTSPSRSATATESMEEDEEGHEPEVPYSDPLLGNRPKEKIPFSASLKSIKDKIPLPRRPKRLFGSGKGEKSSKIPKHDQRSSDEDSLRSGSASDVSMLELNPSESCAKTSPPEEHIYHYEKETSFILDSVVDAEGLRKVATPEPSGGKATDVPVSSGSTNASSSGDSCFLQEKREIDAAYALASIAHAGQDRKDDPVETKGQTDPPAACENSPGMVIDAVSLSDSEMSAEQAPSPVNKSILEMKKSPGIVRCNSAPTGTSEDILQRDTTKASIMTTKTCSQSQLSLDSKKIVSTEGRMGLGTSQTPSNHVDALCISSLKSAQQRRREIKEAARKALRGPNAFNITAPLPSDFFAQGKKQYRSSVAQSPDLSQFLKKSLVNSVEAKNPVSQVSSAVADSSRLLPILKVLLEETRSMNRKEDTSNHYQPRPPLRPNSTLLADTKTLTRDFASLTPNSPQPVTDMQNGSDSVTDISSSEAEHENNPRLNIANNGFANSAAAILAPRAKDASAEVSSTARHTSKAQAAVTQQLFVPQPMHISTVADNKGRISVTNPSQLAMSEQPLTQNPSLLFPQFVTFVPQPNLMMVSTSGGYASATTVRAQAPQLGDPATLFSKGHPAVVCNPSVNLMTSQPDKAQPVFIPTLPTVTPTNDAVRPSVQQKKAILPAGAFSLASNNLRPSCETVYAVTAPTAVAVPRGARGTHRFLQSLPNVRQVEQHNAAILRPALETVSVDNLIPIPRFTNPTSDSANLRGSIPIENPYKVRKISAMKPKDIVPANNTCALGGAVKREPEESNDEGYQSKKEGNQQALSSLHEESKTIEKFRDRLRRDTKVHFILDEDLKIEKVVGQGYYGVVKKGDWFIKGQGKPIPVAIKMLKGNSSGQKDQMLEDFQNEAMNMAFLKHKNIVRLLGIHVSEHDGNLDLRLITEWMPNNSLEHFIFNRKNSLEDVNLLNFAYQIAAGMKYLSDNSLVHRDLSARNVLVIGMDLVKISDFGLSRVFREGEASYQARIKGEESTDRWPLRWYAPESIKHRLFTLASDVWSYGVTFWEIFKLREIDKNHAQPYEEIAVHDVVDYLERGNRLLKPSKCPRAAWELAVDCWKEKPDERPSFYVLYLRLESLIQEL